MKTNLIKAVKIVKLTSLATVICFGCVVVYLKYIVKDIPPFDDSDMEIASVDVREEENAHRLLSLAQVPLTEFNNSESGKKHTMLSESINRSKRIDDETMSKAQFYYKERLDTIKRAADMKYCKGPAIYKPEDKVMNFIFLQSLAKIWIEEERRNFEQGEQEKAFNDTIRIARFGRITEHSEGGFTLIGSIVGNRIKRDSIIALNDFLDSGYLPENPNVTVERMKEFNVSESAWVNVWKNEYRTMSYVLSRYDSDKMDTGITSAFLDDFCVGPNNIVVRFILSLLFKTELTRKMAYDFNKMMISYTTANSYLKIDGTLIESYNPPNSTKEALQLISHGKYGAQLFVAVTIPNYPAIFRSNFLMDTLVDFTRIRIAALKYKSDHGELPETLDSLVPDYIDTIPNDRFDGMPIRYDRDRGIIYSVGLNLKDDSGSYEYNLTENESWRSSFMEKDLVLKITN